MQWMPKLVLLGFIPLPSLPIPGYESIGRTLCGRLLSLIRELITLVYCVFQLLKTEFNESPLSL